MGLRQVVRPRFIGLPSLPATAAEEEIMQFISVEDMVEHGSGMSRANAFAVNNMDAATFDWGSIADDFFHMVPIPPAWQGETIEVAILLHHRKAGLAGTGSPPDDQVRMELGYDLGADDAIVNLGPSNDGTAPNELNVEQQLGTTVDAPTLVSLTGGAGIAVGASDTYLWLRCTRNAGHANDGLSATLYSTGALIYKSA